MSFEQNDPVFRPYESQENGQEMDPYYQPYPNTQPPYGPSYAYSNEEKPQNAGKMAVICLVLSILGFLSGIFLIGLILDVAAIILGIVSLTTGRPGKGVCIVGITLSVLSVILTLVLYFIVGSLASRSFLGSFSAASSASSSSDGSIYSDVSEETTDYTSAQLMENITYTTYRVAQGVLVIYENENPVDVDLDADLVYYNADGSLLSVETDYCWGCAANGKAATVISGPVNENYSLLPYDHYDIAVTAQAVDMDYDAPNYGGEFDIQAHSDSSGSVYATLSNPTGITFDSVELACIYYSGGEVVGLSTEYLWEVGKSAEATFLPPYDFDYRPIPYDEYEILVNSTSYYD